MNLATDVDIVLPCYNSAPWLGEMLESIVAQDGPRWRVIARDDGSSDATAALLDQWSARLGEAMVLLDNPGRRNLGLAGNYTAVLRRAEARWVLTADSDDVWLPGHLRHVTEALEAREREHGPATPLAICADAAVIDEHGGPLAPSFWRWVGSDPRRVRRVMEVAMENPVLGSTMAVNRALLQAALPVPAGFGGQDWWLALVAVAFGHIHPIRRTSILYRRHTVNFSGTPFGGTAAGALGGALRAPGAARARLRKVLFEDLAPQAAVFVDRFRDRLDDNDVEALDALAGLRGRGAIARRLTLARHRLAFASPLKTLGLYALC